VTRGRPTYAFALLAIATALAIAGCGSSNSESSSSASSGGGGAYGGGEGSAASEKAVSGSEGGSSSGAAAVLTVASAPKVGPVLVDSEGFTVYDFHKDKGTTSSCYGACESAWPPVTTAGAAKTGEGAMSSKLGTTKRKDGTTQVTYAGHPLYTFVEDKKPGEANGNDVSAFGAQWYALKGSGEEAGD
jgi:predicted lipoprotein with Yx(FWY)xxD motif